MMEGCGWTYVEELVFHYSSRKQFAKYAQIECNILDAEIIDDRWEMGYNCWQLKHSHPMAFVWNPTWWKWLQINCDNSICHLIFCLSHKSSTQMARHSTCNMPTVCVTLCLIRTASKQRDGLQRSANSSRVVHIAYPTFMTFYPWINCENLLFCIILRRSIHRFSLPVFLSKPIISGCIKRLVSWRDSVLFQHVVCLFACACFQSSEHIQKTHIHTNTLCNARDPKHCFRMRESLAASAQHRICILTIFIQRWMSFFASRCHLNRHISSINISKWSNNMCELNYRRFKRRRHSRACQPLLSTSSSVFTMQWIWAIYNHAIINTHAAHQMAWWRNRGQVRVRWDARSPDDGSCLQLLAERHNSNMWPDSIAASLTMAYLLRKFSTESKENGFIGKLAVAYKYIPNVASVYPPLKQNVVTISDWAHCSAYDFLVMSSWHGAASIT